MKLKKLRLKKDIEKDSSKPGLTCKTNGRES